MTISLQDFCYLLNTSTWYQLYLLQKNMMKKVLFRYSFHSEYLCPVSSPYSVSSLRLNLLVLLQIAKFLIYKNSQLITKQGNYFLIFVTILFLYQDINNPKAFYYCNHPHSSDHRHHFYSKLYLLLYYVGSFSDNSINFIKLSGSCIRLPINCICNAVSGETCG